MKLTKLAILFLGLMITPVLKSCFWEYGINETNMFIGRIDTYCHKKGFWENIMKEHSVDNIKDSNYAKNVSKLADKPFTSKYIYFASGPEEIVAISENYYTIRYFYNEDISDGVLDDYSSELTEAEKQRVIKRVNDLFAKYECDHLKKD